MAATALAVLPATESRAGGDQVDLRVRKLTVERYRGFRELSINGFGRVNLITGKNNTGKSSILEVLRILVHRASPRVIEEILGHREEASFADSRHSSSGESLSLIGTLFNGYPFHGPNPTLDTNPISIRIDGTLHPASLMMRITDVVRGAEHGQDTLIEDPYFGRDRALLFEVNDGKGRYGQGLLSGYRGQDRNWIMSRIARQGVPEPQHKCVTVDAYAAQKTSRFGDLWDGIALSEDETYVVDALKIIEPKITAVSMIGGGQNSKRRRAIARTADFDRPVTLRSFGDGMNRLFGIILSLVNAREGLFLIDEFESGLHYSVHYSLWKMVFRLAKDLDVQVFATSHSSDAIKAFGRVAGENEHHEAVLVKLERIREQIIPTVFEGDELGIITDHQIEVR